MRVCIYVLVFQCSAMVTSGSLELLFYFLVFTCLSPANIFFINEKIPACDMMSLRVIFHFDARLHVRKNMIIFYS